MLMTEVCSAHPPARPAHRVALFADLMRSSTQDLKPSLCPTQDLPPYATQVSSFGFSLPYVLPKPFPAVRRATSHPSPRILPIHAALTSQAIARSFAVGRVARFLKTGRGEDSIKACGFRGSIPLSGIIRASAPASPFSQSWHLQPSILCPFYPGRYLTDLATTLYPQRYGCFHISFQFIQALLDGRMWCHCRMVYLPMSYLYSKRFVGPITPLILSLRKEIYMVPFDKVDWNKARNSCAKDYPTTMHLEVVAEPDLFCTVKEHLLQMTNWKGNRVDASYVPK
ncbi:hypothetical protein Taro_024713 [Colocasia esculenta]|uniref:Uncharacterized protein n=1 Tax=Colocasia esculenta TaxID=4460 RepID=A0A843VFB8_COLES|nr:hypothetical protein [Colocasia esculenta]